MKVRRRHLEKTVVAFFVSTLFYSRQVGSLTDSNRYYLHWELADGLVVIAAISTLALTAVAISIFLEVKKLAFPTRLFNHGFLLALTIGVLAFQTIRPRRSGWVQLALMVAIGVVGYSFGNKRSQLVRWAKNVCLVLSPYVFIVFFMLLTYGSWGPNDATETPFQNDAGPSPVFFIVFDGWSYPHSVVEGELSPAFSSLAELAATSFFFEGARSPARSTRISVPSMIFQIDPAAGRTIDLWVDGDRFLPSTSAKSLFQLSKMHGYQTALIGYYFPYCLLLGDQLDRCLSMPHVPKGESLAEKLAVSFVRNLRYMPDPISRRADELLYSYFYSRNWYRLHRRQRQEALRLIEDAPRSVFGFLHFVVPHRPYVFNPDGTYFWQHEPGSPRGPSTLDGYLRTLEYLDRFIGQLLGALRASGKYADALIVMTADHGLEQDRVPLVVKFPQQTTGYRVSGRFGNHQLQSAIESVLRGEGDSEKWRRQLVDLWGLEVEASRAPERGARLPKAHSQR